MFTNEDQKQLDKFKSTAINQTKGINNASGFIKGSLYEGQSSELDNQKREQEIFQYYMDNSLDIDDAFIYEEQKHVEKNYIFGEYSDNEEEEKEIIKKYQEQRKIRKQQEKDDEILRRQRRKEQKQKQIELEGNLAARKRLSEKINNRPKVYSVADLEKLINKQDRMVSNLSKLNKKDKAEAAMLKQGNLADTKAEIEEIDKVLKMYETKNFQGTDFYEAMIDTVALKFKKGRDVSQMLVNENSRWWDSDLMEAAKKDVQKLSIELEKIKNIPASKEAIDNILLYYDMAIKSCEDYTSVKKKNKRYQAVETVWQCLSYEKSLLLGLRNGSNELIKGTMGNLLHMSDASATDVKRKEKVVINPKADVYKESTTMTGDLFKNGFSFEEFFKGKSQKEKVKASKAFIELRNALSQFQKGVPDCIDVTVFGKKVTLLQKADNALFVVDDHRMYPLDITANLFHNQIEKEMLNRSELFDKDSLIQLMASYNSMNITAGQYLDIRTNLIDYLTKNLELKKDAFNNIRRSDLVELATSLLTGESDKEKVKEKLNAITTESKDVETMINGVELTEIMAINKQREAEIKNRVSMYEVQVKANDNDWTEEEKKVKNLLADFVFAEDTLIMDENVRNPKEFVRKVLQQNIDALAILVEQEQNGNSQLISSIMDRMNLSKISDTVDFATTIGESVKILVKNLKKDYIGDKKLNRQQLKDKLEDTLKNQQDLKLDGYLDAAHKSMDDNIKAACDIMQENVSKITDSIFAKTDDEQEDSLKAIMKNAAKADSGQGAFVQNVLKNYFKDSNVLDQRAMLASVLRTAGKVNDNISDAELVKEIKERKLTAYSSLYNLEYLSDGREWVGPNEDQKKLIEKFRQEKIALRTGANYLSGLIRGGGPLLHKLMQGLNEEILPEEMRVAIRDVKSKLSPIPMRVVMTQMDAMIERSEGAISRIEVKDNMGAASVGQTFRCRIYGPSLPKEGKNVIIKLLRPDVQNRMKREEKIMLKCAGNVDKGMYETYLGQLPNYYNELDLTKEKANIEEGKVYDNKFGDVESEKINTMINATVNSLALEEAKGQTLDDILLDAEKYREETKKVLYKQAVMDGKTVYVEKFDITEENVEKSKTVRKKLIAKANELMKKRDIMKNIATAWLEEAIYGKGYYHADLHAGNILISDTKGTLIDYGNAVRLSGDQQTAITQMMAAAGSKSYKLFMYAFEQLLGKGKDKDFEKNYPREKRLKLQEEFKNVLSLGIDGEDAGYRISCALIRATQLGVKLPPAIYNFSQGQIRLQKSIDDINHMVDSFKSDIMWTTTALVDTNKKGCAVTNAINDCMDCDTEEELSAKIHKHIEDFEPISKEDFTEQLLDNTYEEGDLSKGIAEVNKRKDFDKDVLGVLSNLEDRLSENLGELPDFKSFKKEWIKYRDKWKARYDAVKNNPDINDEQKKVEIAKIRKEQEDNIADEALKMTPGDLFYNEETYSYFGGQAVLWIEFQQSLLSLDEKAVNKVINIYDKIIPDGLLLEQKVNELRNLQDRKKLKADVRERLVNEIYDLYSSIFESRKNNNTRFTAVLNEIKHVYGKNLQMEKYNYMFSEKTKEKDNEKTLGQQFKEKMEEYFAFALKYAPQKDGKLKNEEWDMQNVEGEDKQKLNTILNELKELHSKISYIQLKRYYDGRFDEKPDIKSYNFSNVVIDLGEKYRGESIKRIGVSGIARMNKISELHATTYMGMQALAYTGMMNQSTVDNQLKAWQKEDAKYYRDNMLEGDPAVEEEEEEDNKEAIKQIVKEEDEEDED